MAVRTYTLGALGLALTATVLAVGLPGPQAAGYPAGAAVSFGANPVFAYGGPALSNGYGTVWASVLTAPADQDAVVTDVYVATATGGGTCDITASVMALSAPGDRGSSAFLVSPDQPFKMSFQSGLLVPAGQSLVLSGSNPGGCSTRTLHYTVSGYYAAP